MGIRHIALMILIPAVVFGCTKSGSSSESATLVIPVATAVPGVTLAGPLAGKKMYLLPTSVNPPGCWIDSIAWTGSELLFGISAINWTTLDVLSTVAYDPACSPLPGFVAQGSPGHTGNFNIYRAVVQGSSWVLANLPLNAGQTTSLAAPKLSGNTLAFVKYEKGASSFGNIYFSIRLGDNTYASPTAFPLNSVACNEDNPFLFNNGTGIVFESSRANPAGTACGATQKLWSSQFDGSSWSTPVPLTGAPATATNSVTQPWMDASQTHLYWSGTGSDCGAAVTGCVLTASGSGSAWSSGSQIITPTAVASFANGVLGLVGQFTQAGNYAFVACGIVADVDPTGSTSGLIFGRFKMNIQACVIY